jgi:hypothetical protein
MDVVLRGNEVHRLHAIKNKIFLDKSCGQRKVKGKVIKGSVAALMRLILFIKTAREIFGSALLGLAFVVMMENH